VRILFINTLYTPNVVGGAERSVQFLAESLVQLGHQVAVVSLTSRGGIYVDWVNGTKVYYVGLKNLYWPIGSKENPKLLKPLWHVLDTYNPLMARQVAHVLDAERPDLVHTNNLSGFTALTWQLVKQRHVPLVHTLRDYYLLCPRNTMFRNGENCDKRCTECRLYGLTRKHLSNQVDTVVGISRFILERHLEFGYFADTPRKRVVPNACQEAPAPPALDTRSLPVWFGYLGQLHPTKGVEMLLGSAVQLPAGSWGLSIAGRGYTNYELYLRGRHRTSAIKFLGHTKPEDFFRRIDVLVVPSLWHEPFGRVVIEAYAHGVPVIASNRGGLPELVEQAQTGFLFNPNRPDDLTVKLQRCIDKPRIIDDMRPACLRMAKGFLPDVIVEQYLKVYSDVMGDA
jgi:glycosyltransferase involved in cell wall biosynthesis